MKLAIVKYNAGNTASVENALHRLNVEPVITDDADAIVSADKVIFPGVGEASSAMRYLRERGLDKVIASLTQPVLGICLGMQLMCEYSEENDTECIGILSQTVKRFDLDGLKVPHMGWNRVEARGASDVFRDTFGWAYFVHGFYVPLGEDTTAVCEYGVKFSAAVSKGNFHAAQFHPEKSGDVGTCVLQNFINL